MQRREHNVASKCSACAPPRRPLSPGRDRATSRPPEDCVGGPTLLPAPANDLVAPAGRAAAAAAAAQRWLGSKQSREIWCKNIVSRARCRSLWAAPREVAHDRQSGRQQTHAPVFRMV